MKISLIGAGAFSEFCLQSYYKYIPGLEVVTVYDLNSSAAEQFAKKHSIPTVAQTINNLLEVPTNAVVILTPPNTHFELGSQILNAGKNVLVEKPIAFTNENATELVAIADKNNCRFISNLILRYHHFHQEIKNLAMSNKYGKLLSITTVADLAEYPKDHWYWNEKVSGGFFLNTYTHFFDLYRYISGKEVSSASHQEVQNIGHEITIQLNDLSAKLTTNLHVKNEDERVETIYYFEKGTITTQGWFPDSLIVHETGQSPVTTSETQLKEDYYGKILATILSDLLTPPTNPTITHNDLREAVRVALLAQSNSN